MLLTEITQYLEKLAPLQLQESYDNSGLLVGNPDMEINGILISLDMTEEVMAEALEKKCNLIVSHHPLIFKGLKKITDETAIERMVIGAIKNNVAIYAIHTNLDNVDTGVNKILCEKLGLVNLSILAPKEDLLCKLVTFCPEEYAGRVRSALFSAGAGNIGNYDSCSFTMEGTGTFRGSEDSNPFVGEKGKLNLENEVRIETVFPKYLKKNMLTALLREHPYEEVAYDIYALSNSLPNKGAGMLGELKSPRNILDFLNFVKDVTGAKCIRHSGLIHREISKIAVCGGAGSFLIDQAIRAQADVFITGDIKYHDFFMAEKKLVIADIGHYESEQFVKELIYSELIKKFSNFAVLISEAHTNSVNYL